MKTKPYTLKSLRLMALWTIGALIVLNSVFTIEKDAKSSTLDINSMDVYQQAMIPLLYPSQLLNFDPFKILEDIEVAILPKPAPKKIIEKQTPALPPSRESAHTRFDSIIHTAAARYQVDPAMVKAIILAESSYNPKAVSRVGARGLMQLMPATARELGVRDSFNPEQNIHGGVKYFKQLLVQFDGNVKLALAAYNAGRGRVMQYKGIPPFKDTRFYIKKVLEYHQQYSSQTVSVDQPSPDVSKG
jgi:soluble lytic murein transglycosylase-like protein